MLNLSVQLLKHFAEGTLPATLVQVFASAALADGWGEADDIANQLAIGASATFCESGDVSA